MKNKYQLHSCPLSETKQLMELWLGSHVNDSYQSIVLEYLDRLPAMAQWTEIDREIRKTNQQTSHYHRIENLKYEYDLNVQQLKLEVNKLDDWSSKINKRYPYMQEICDLLNTVRKLGMLMSEQVTSMFGNFKYDPEKKPSIGSYYLKIFTTINSQLQFLKETTLASYIPFSKSDDPLLVDVLKRITTGHHYDRIIEDQNVTQLFQINASYLYRLLRSQQKIKRYIALSYNTQQQFDPSNGLPRNLQRTHQQSIRKHESDLKPLQKQYKDFDYIKIQDFKNDQKDRLMSIDRRRIVRCEPITIFSQMERHNQAYIARKSRNLRRSDQEREQEATLPETIKQSTIAGNSEVNFQQYHKKQAYNKRSKTIQNYSLRKAPQQSKSYNSFVHKKAFSKDEKTTLVSNGLKRSWIRDDHECQCRNKSKKNQLSSSYENITESDYEQTRKAIIQEIKQKYKEIAKKQIRYELSKLGDLTYHRMKSRMLKKKNNIQQYSPP